MLLCIDAGNSFVKLAYHDGEAWLPTQRLSLPEFCGNPTQALRYPTQRIVVANVAGASLRDAVLRAYRDVPITWVAPARQALGVRNCYAQPQQLGVDRWAMLVAAHHLVPGAKLIVSIGTAVTTDLLMADGAFIGGMIAPGLALMRDALRQGTHAVAPVPGQVTALPGNTADAVQTGLCYAILGVIEHAAATLQAKCAAPIQCLISGGGAAEITPHLNRPYQVVDNLVLEGLRILAQQES